LPPEKPSPGADYFSFFGAIGQSPPRRFSADLAGSSFAPQPAPVNRAHFLFLAVLY
jgi:hypothetical protein